MWIHIHDTNFVFNNDMLIEAGKIYLGRDFDIVVRPAGGGANGGGPKREEPKRVDGI
jgi:hypothetical protein